MECRPKPAEVAGPRITSSDSPEKRGFTAPESSAKPQSVPFYLEIRIMGNQDTARIKESAASSSCETEPSIPQDAHEGAGRSDQTPSQKRGTARVNLAGTRRNLRCELMPSAEGHGLAVLDTF